MTGSVELTFELPDSAKECFHEIIEKDVESTLEFQVFYLLFILLLVGFGTKFLYQYKIVGHNVVPTKNGGWWISYLNFM